MTDLKGKGVDVDLRKVSRLFQVGGETFQALTDVTLSIPSGVHWSLVGASGSGKSTLLYMMGLLERPSSGEVWIDGQRTDTLKTGERALIRNRRIGFVFQSFQLIPRTTSLENVEMPLLYRKVPSRERQERARAILAQVGLSGRENHYPSQLSGGQQQRVAIARALVTAPGLVLADEPTGNLDSASSKDILELLEHLRSIHRFTLILVTHDPQVASRAERQIRLSDGRVVGGEP
ncbi:MAG: ABC transporter ATP-binding protein [Nitrospirae bacterium]|jgi:putative ABC transport system ATP-binding protein|nr:ABC transporter ATP-binding protein [Nitrospirota bacterium]